MPSWIRDLIDLKTQISSVRRSMRRDVLVGPRTERERRFPYSCTSNPNCRFFGLISRIDYQIPFPRNFITVLKSTSHTPTPPHPACAHTPTMCEYADMRVYVPVAASHTYSCSVDVRICEYMWLCVGHIICTPQAARPRLADGRPIAQTMKASEYHYRPKSEYFGILLPTWNRTPPQSDQIGNFPYFVSNYKNINRCGSKQLSLNTSTIARQADRHTTRSFKRKPRHVASRDTEMHDDCVISS
jgi:hypothetical protein